MNHVLFFISRANRSYDPENVTPNENIFSPSDINYVNKKTKISLFLLLIK